MDNLLVVAYKGVENRNRMIDVQIQSLELELKPCQQHELDACPSSALGPTASRISGYERILGRPVMDELGGVR